jgi:hypothetical protein
MWYLCPDFALYTHKPQRPESLFFNIVFVFQRPKAQKIDSWHPRRAPEKARSAIKVKKIAHANTTMEEYDIPCDNYDLCKAMLHKDHVENFGNRLCTTCGDWFKIGGFGWNTLHFRETDDPCAVCLQPSRKQLYFPANCGHWFCVSCSRKILLWDETRYHLSPVFYGCPPCPNECINPEKGRQCYCEEYDVVQEQWEQQEATRFKEWNEEEHLSIELGETTQGSVFNSQRCPICRTKYER